MAVLVLVNCIVYDYKDISTRITGTLKGHLPPLLCELPTYLVS